MPPSLQEVDSLREAHVRAVNSRDVEAVLEGMAPDIVYLAPQAPPFVGLEAVGDMLRAAYASFEPEIVVTPSDVEIQGEVVVEWGCLSGRIIPIDGSRPIPNDGKYISIYRRSPAGAWQLAYHAYNPGPCS